MLVRIGFLLVFVAFCQSSFLFAQTNALGDCDMPSKNCLMFVADELHKVETHSMQWYSLKLMQLDSLMTTKEFKLLKQELNDLGENINHPPMFVTHLHIYQAKLDLIGGNTAQATGLLSQSLQDLEQINQAFYSPMRMINIANLMQSLQQHQQSLSLLERIETEFEISRDSYLKLELYGNLGHVHRHLKNYDKALSYYKKSLQFAIELEVEQQIAVLYEHVGNTYLNTSQDEQAELNYIAALSHANKDASETTIIHAKITLAYFYLQQSELLNVRKLVNDIDPEKVESHQKNKWQAINDELNQGN